MLPEVSRGGLHFIQVTGLTTGRSSQHACVCFICALEHCHGAIASLQKSSCICFGHVNKSAVVCAGSPGIAAYDEKNIRRRVYDALNVLMAMDIIIKDKKDISWKGLPSAPHAQLEKLKEERAALRQKILNQQAYLQVIHPTLARQKCCHGRRAPEDP